MSLRSPSAMEPSRVRPGNANRPGRNRTCNPRFWSATVATPALKRLLIFNDLAPSEQRRRCWTTPALALFLALKRSVRSAEGSSGSRREQTSLRPRRRRAPKRSVATWNDTLLTCSDLETTETWLRALHHQLEAGARRRGAGAPRTQRFDQHHLHVRRLRGRTRHVHKRARRDSGGRLQPAVA